ncbi:MAG: molybdopterin biosynthesis protein [Candidatus Nezhaarchaeota archaeon]|nr:molybdopterin biosynthesis protein [Candidatus Nezhaarchaeota archaeon]
MAKVFHELVPLEDVEAALSKHLRLEPLGVEEVDLVNSLGRTLAEDVYSPIDYPPFDRSEVDGYAVHAEDTYGADEERPAVLAVTGGSPVGRAPQAPLGRGEAFEIATGAVVPREANAVVMEEYTDRENGRVKVYRPVAPGENVVHAGSDISLGDLALSRGTLLGPRELGLLAALGKRRVKVYRKVKVAVFSTGNEVVEPGEKLELGQIYDSNSFFIVSSLLEMGAEARYAGHLPDDYQSILHALRCEVEESDVIITSGGTSAGAGDLVYRAFDDLGRPGLIIHGVKVKPGKPTAIAVARGKLLIGLPGFPLSCAMVFLTVVRPLIAKLMGLELDGYQSVKATFPFRVRTGQGKTWLIPVSLVSSANGLVAYPVTMKSGDVSPLVSAEGYVRVPEGKELLEGGETVDVFLMSRRTTTPELTIIGSHDVALYRVIEVMNMRGRCKVIAVGSLRGLQAAASGEADLAPVHLLDEETGDYNLPFIRRMNLEGKVRLIRGYARRIGFISRPGLDVNGFEDLFTKGYAFVNRNRGSGTRTFIDVKLREACAGLHLRLEKVPSLIRGYTYEVKTHTAVAAAVAHGRADVGVGIEYAARAYNLSFKPLTWEVMDFAVPSERLQKASVERFREALRSRRLAEALKAIPGYELLKNSGELI